MTPRDCLPPDGSGLSIVTQASTARVQDPVELKSLKLSVVGNQVEQPVAFSSRQPIQVVGIHPAGGAHEEERAQFLVTRQVLYGGREDLEANIGLQTRGEDIAGPTEGTAHVLFARQAHGAGQGEGARPLLAALSRLVARHALVPSHALLREVPVAEKLSIGAIINGQRRREAARQEGPVHAPISNPQQVQIVSLPCQLGKRLHHAEVRHVDGIRRVVEHFARDPLGFLQRGVEIALTGLYQRRTGDGREVQSRREDVVHDSCNRKRLRGLHDDGKSSRCCVRPSKLRVAPFTRHEQLCAHIHRLIAVTCNVIADAIVNQIDVHSRCPRLHGAELENKFATLDINLREFLEEERNWESAEQSSLGPADMFTAKSNSWTDRRFVASDSLSNLREKVGGLLTCATVKLSSRETVKDEIAGYDKSVSSEVKHAVRVHEGRRRGEEELGMGNLDREHVRKDQTAVGRQQRLRLDVSSDLHGRLSAAFEELEVVDVKRGGPGNQDGKLVGNRQPEAHGTVSVDRRLVKEEGGSKSLVVGEDKKSDQLLLALELIGMRSQLLLTGLLEKRTSGYVDRNTEPDVQPLLQELALTPTVLHAVLVSRAAAIVCLRCADSSCPALSPTRTLVVVEAQGTGIGRITRTNPDVIADHVAKKAAGTS
eukprot:749264-Hanusia_phi.AAC.6